MNEDTPNPDQVPESQQNVPAPDPSDAAPQPEVGEPAATPAEPEPFPSEPAPPEPFPSEPTPLAPESTPFTPGAADPAPAPPVAPGGWPPAESSAFPTPEEDAALREERAKRFGGEPAPVEEPLPDAATQALPQAPNEPAPVPPVVTPIPAPPATQPGESPFPPTTQMPAPAGPPAPPMVDDFEGFEEQGPVSRAAAHWWTILITLVFAPVAWYLFTDGGVRITWAISQGEFPSIPVFIEFGLGLVALFIYLLAARWSSLGSIILGSVFFALGVAFLAFPEEAYTFLLQSNQYFGRLGQFGLNVLEHLTSTLESGRMIVYGLTMIMVGVVSHGARRQGRREERTKIALEG